MIEMFFCLMVWHALADFPLQGDYLAKEKNPWIVKNESSMPWWWAMSMHSLIHAGGVALITQSIWLGLAEFVLHFIIDFKKCDKALTFMEDQLLHVLCKLFWVILAGLLL